MRISAWVGLKKLGDEHEENNVHKSAASSMS